MPPPDSELIPTQADSYSNPSKTTSGAKPCLSQAQTSKIKQGINLSQATHIAGDKDPQNGRGQVNCQCGWPEPEPDMVSPVDIGFTFDLF